MSYDGATAIRLAQPAKRRRATLSLAGLEHCPTCQGFKRHCACLHDIKDPSAFVHATINSARLVLTSEEREELHAEGMAILSKLAHEYRPHIEGHASEGRFSGYAAMYLPRKLGDAWHRLNPSHQLVTHNCEQLECGPDCDQNGKRRWRYGERAVSLEAIVADDPDRHGLLAGKADESDLAKRLRDALREEAERRIEVTVHVGQLLGEGATAKDAAEILGLTSEQVIGHVNDIGAVAYRLQSEDS